MYVHTLIYLFITLHGIYPHYMHTNVLMYTPIHLCYTYTYTPIYRRSYSLIEGV